MGLGIGRYGSAGRYFCPCRLGKVLGKGGQCANKFRESQIRKLADLPNLLGLWTFCKCGFVDLRFADPGFICGFKISAHPQKPKFFLQL